MISVHSLNSRSFRHVRGFRTIYSSKRHTTSLILADLATFIYFLLIRSVGDFFVWQCCVCIWNFPEKKNILQLERSFLKFAIYFKLGHYLMVHVYFCTWCALIYLECLIDLLSEQREVYNWHRWIAQSFENSARVLALICHHPRCLELSHANFC